MRIVALKNVMGLFILLFSRYIFATDNAVILMYHHVSESTPTITSVTPDTFKQHMSYLAEHHQVLPLETVIRKLRKKESLGDKVVVITFDDGYVNIHNNAHPILRQHKFPYTVFINPSLISQQASQLSWQQIKEMSRQGVTFANHGNDHQHMLQRGIGESEKVWLSKIMNSIDHAEQELQEQLGYSLRYLAYPYGEFDFALKTQLTKQGYVGFSQHSGAIASYSDFGALPRYPVAGIYSDLDSLKVKLNSLAMPIHKLEPYDPKLAFNTSDPSLSFAVEEPDFELQKLACFYKGKSLAVIRRGDSIHINFPGVIPPGRSRVNCTAPSIKHQGRFYWYSHPWFVAGKNGQWLE
jgi:peptidoglycan/xylan/chitin deacetylase (PgdA/CDA1 family)